MCTVAFVVPCCTLVGVYAPSGAIIGWHSCESSCRGSCQYLPGDLFGLRVGVAEVEREAEMFPFQEGSRFHLSRRDLIIQPNVTSVKSVERLHDHTTVGPTIARPPKQLPCSTSLLPGPIPARKFYHNATIVAYVRTSAARHSRASLSGRSYKLCNV
jgi:hypothetical protein